MTFLFIVCRIEKRLTNSFMFKALSREDLNIVIGAMAERHFKQGETVIKQGDAGAVLYVVEEG